MTPVNKVLMVTKEILTTITHKQREKPLINNVNDALIHTTLYECTKPFQCYSLRNSQKSTAACKDLLTEGNSGVSLQICQEAQQSSYR
jgi:hypothetical protein